MEKKHKKFFIDYFVVNLGLIIIAAGISLFFIPVEIAPGGVSGIAIVINSITGFPVGLTMLGLNIPIFMAGIKIFGKSYGFKTFFGTIMLSVYVDLIYYLFPQANNIIDFSKGGNLLLGTVYGGLLAGLGLGLIMKYGGSTGGTDILSQILNRYLKIPMGYSIMIVNFFILSFAALVLGFEKALYSLVGLYILGIVVNKVFEGVSYRRMVYIISDKYEEIKEIILNDLDSTGNGIEITGLYTDKKRKMVMAVMRNKKIYMLKEYIKEVDPKAFIIITEVYEVLGEGFTPIKGEE